MTMHFFDNNVAVAYACRWKAHCVQLQKDAIINSIQGAEATLLLEMLTNFDSITRQW